MALSISFSHVMQHTNACVCERLSVKKEWFRFDMSAYIFLKAIWVHDNTWIDDLYILRNNIKKKDEERSKANCKKLTHRENHIQFLNCSKPTPRLFNTALNSYVMYSHVYWAHIAHVIGSYCWFQDAFEILNSHKTEITEDCALWYHVSDADKKNYSIFHSCSSLYLWHTHILFKKHTSSM